MPEHRRPIDAGAVETARAEVLDSGPASKARRLLDCICDPTRVNIVRALRPGALAASDLALVIGRTPSATSQHLRVLREIEVVVPERRGNVVRYRLAGGATAAILSDVATAFDRLGHA